jgi:hypothetical protein
MFSPGWAAAVVVALASGLPPGLYHQLCHRPPCPYRADADADDHVEINHLVAVFPV